MRYTNDPAAFSIAFAAGVTADGPYGKVSRTKREPRAAARTGANLGQAVVNESMNVDGGFVGGARRGIAM